jgi:hypothetical protein
MSTFYFQGDDKARIRRGIKIKCRIRIRGRPIRIRIAAVTYLKLSQFRIQISDPGRYRVGFEYLSQLPPVHCTSSEMTKMSWTEKYK